jgi:spermidine synthase
MRPFDTLASARTPDGRELTLHRRDGDYFMQLDGDELMSTRRAASERLLGEVACREVAGAVAPRVLVGGLGLGFTLRAVLEGLPGGRVVVAEVFPEVVAWGREHLGSVHGTSLEDPRAEVVVRDVWELLAPGAGWDAVLLDVDNGPDAWCLERNARLYSGHGLDRIARSLTSTGVLAIWSARPAPAFEKRLRSAGYDVARRVAHAHAGKGPRHVVMVAKRAREKGRRANRGGS